VLSGRIPVNEHLADLRPAGLVALHCHTTVVKRGLIQDVAMAEPPTSFAQQGILAPVELTKGKLIYVQKKDF
jgi:hypothetical protein